MLTKYIECMRDIIVCGLREIYGNIDAEINYLFFDYEYLLDLDFEVKVNEETQKIIIKGKKSDVRERYVNYEGTLKTEIGDQLGNITLQGQNPSNTEYELILNTGGIKNIVRLKIKNGKIKAISKNIIEENYSDGETKNIEKLNNNAESLYGNTIKKG